MERLLYLLPKVPQPAWVRYAATTLVMVLCFATQLGFNEPTGFIAFYLLFTGIFASGVMFTRGASLYATALGATLAYLLAGPIASPRSYVPALAMFSVAGLLVGVFSEALRNRLEKAMRAGAVRLCCSWSWPIARKITWQCCLQ